MGLSLVTPHTNALMLILSYLFMRNSKTIIILGLLCLFVGAYLYTVFVPSGNEDDAGLTCFFSQEGNLTSVYNKDFTTNVTSTLDNGFVYVYLDDSLILKTKSSKNETPITISTRLLTLGAHSLKVSTSSATDDYTADERVLYVLSDIKPAAWKMLINNQYPHRDSSFTQGLTFAEGKLYEGTGDPNGTGETFIGEIDLKQGRILTKKEVEAPFFGEGIAIVKDELFQITWQNNTCFVYDKNTFEPIKQFNYSGEGWGLTYDGTYLIMSDGSETITFRDPKTFKEVKSIQVFTNEGAITKLNELEFFDGLIYANIWTSNLIAVIEPETGRVIATIDATEAVQKGKGNGEVLNGIAYNDRTKKIYITGKFWNTLFEVSFIKPNPA